MLKKIVLLKFFPIFLKKNFHGNKIFNKKLLLLKCLIDLEKIYRNRVTISIKARFLPKFIFHRNFLFERSGKILTKQFFPTYLYKLGEI